MGWFDDSDEDEPEQHQQQQQVEDDDQEDPLDAYMKSLDNASIVTTASITASATATAANYNHYKPERLDVENAEEATSHWMNEPLTAAPTLETKSETSLHQENNTKYASAAVTAQDAAWASIGFVQATHQQQKQSPFTLEQVQHDLIPYEPFHKEFGKGSDSVKGHSWRNQHNVTCTPGTMDPILDFDEIKDILGNELFGVIQSRGYQKPTLVQSQTLAVALAGKDCLITASTGSGKTLAYIWPMVVHCCDQRELLPGEGPIGLVLVPTRELAMQVQKQAQIMVQALKGKSIAITGGVGRYHLVQDFAKRGCELVVATPGRFLDVLAIKKNGISLRRVTMVVLDEADKMLDMGFESQVTEILKNVRPDRQSMLISATMGRKVEQVTKKWLQNPVRISVGKTGEASEHVQQHVMVLPSYDAKKEWLVQMLPVLENLGSTIVFVSTRVDCESVADVIRQQNPTLILETLHGDKHPSDRQAALKAFANGKVLILIATDVASRGLDIANVSTVINFDAAKNLDVHTHRVGRAGRLAKDSQEHRQGTAYTLLTHKNADFAHVLMNAFEREARDVSLELKQLAGKSRRSGNVDPRRNKSGIGFSDETLASERNCPSWSLSAAPPAKKSRWS